MTNPVVGTIGTVLLGVALGAVGGGVFAKTNEFSLTVSPQSVAMTTGTQKPAKDAK